jgi:mannose-1-phosphate guanylyltransferase
MENQSDKVIRNWGYYRVLHTVGSNVKLKELTVEPGKSLSMQRHFKRKELWFVAEGIASLYSNDNCSTKIFHVGTFYEHSYIIIEDNEWHQLANEQDIPLKIIEIQFGEECIEEDIQRLSTEVL